MESTQRPLPRARTEALVLQELPGELLVYDTDRHQAHCLNRVAALVWRHCDGQTSLAQITALLPQELQSPQIEAVVSLALEQLERAHLLQEPLTRAADAGAYSHSRRALVRKLAAVGGLALVTSIVAPEAAQAATCISSGHFCAPGLRCCDGSHCTGLGKTC